MQPLRHASPPPVYARIAAVAEIVALGVWLGALAAFAFAFAPVAFHLIAPLDVTRFAQLIAVTLALLSKWGYVLGAIALAAAALRRAFLRAALAAAAVALTFYHQHAIVQAMIRTPNVTGPAYHALHARSTQTYGAALLCVGAALVIAAYRRAP